jgi:hypothetical protein
VHDEESDVDRAGCDGIDGRVDASFVGRNFTRRLPMFLIRDIMFCKPGQVRPMAQKFLALAKVSGKMGLGPMRGS